MIMGDKSASTDENAKIKHLAQIDKNSLPADGGPEYNRLIFSRSPYLLQHAENPVDWYQWGEEAFAKAKNENKPVFLSIGYATCHWCHVMERESFEDDEVADVLNRYFVPIKVDREERPDVDDQYMTAAQMMGGGGGWPLNMFLDDDGKPFYAVAYVPKTSCQGTPGFIELLKKIADVWKTQRDVVDTSCAEIIKNLAESSEPTPAPIPGSDILEKTWQHLESAYDRNWGGFGSAPKFPRPLFISYLLRFWNRMKNPSALEMTEHSLSMMRRGGIYDHLGYGFHRYTVDQKWLIPHFEKMLYDQGMLAIAYLEAFQATGNDYFRNVAGEIFEHVRRDMTSPEGGFYSAWDADTEGVEGKYYLWTLDEVKSLLGEEAARTFSTLYDITAQGNFEGENILHLHVDPDEYAERTGGDGDNLRENLEEWRNQLLSARQDRIRPLRDEKILVSWNGLMIAAFARGYAVTGEDRYLEMASNAVAFVEKRLVREDGRLLRSYYVGESAIPAFLEDYAFFTWGLIELYEATLDGKYLSDATQFSRKALRLFVDEETYGLFDTGNDTENVLVRKKSALDGVIPSGNSVAAMNFLKLGKIAENARFRDEGEGILRSLMGNALEHPTAYLFSLMGVDFLHGPDVDVTLVGKRDDPAMKELHRAVSSRYIPYLVLRHKEESAESGYRTIGGQPAAYVCHGGVCRPPVTGRDNLEKLLDVINSE